MKEISKELNRDLYTFKPILNASSQNAIVNSLKWKTNKNLRIKEIYLENQQLLVITGKSGIGKTTLLDNIIGLNNPQKSQWEIELNTFNKILGIRQIKRSMI